MGRMSIRTDAGLQAAFGLRALALALSFDSGC